MDASETYYVLQRTYMGRSSTVVHSLHATRELAEEREQIERAFDNSGGFGNFTYHIEERDAQELRNIVAALDAAAVTAKSGWLYGTEQREDLPCASHRVRNCVRCYGL